MNKLTDILMDMMIYSIIFILAFSGMFYWIDWYIATYR